MILSPDLEFYDKKEVLLSIKYHKILFINNTIFIVIIINYKLLYKKHVIRAKFIRLECLVHRYCSNPN